MKYIFLFFVLYVIVSCSVGAKGKTGVQKRRNARENFKSNKTTTKIRAKEILPTIESTNSKDTQINTDSSEEDDSNDRTTELTGTQNEAIVVLPGAYISTVNEISINNILIIGTADGNLHGIRKDNMEIMWTSTTGRPLLSAHKVSTPSIPCIYLLYLM